MSKIVFFPLGNADTELILTDSGKLILIDFFYTEEEGKSDVMEEINKYLAELGHDYIDVVAFTHLDKDHYQGFSNFFELKHANKYQGNERIKIKELWVPASIIVEAGEQVKEEGKILREEARYRFKNNDSIKVVSNPSLLQEWLEANDLSLSSVQDSIQEAGQIVSTFSLEEDGVKIFVHAPFAADIDEDPDIDIDRNDSSLVLHMTFLNESNEEIKAMFGADSNSEVWEGIMKVTEYYENEDYLYWDIFKISHHGSYSALNKNKEEWDETYEPIEEVKTLFEKYGNEKSLIISTSNTYEEGENSDQPPSPEALDYYKKIADLHDGNLIITMDASNSKTPGAITIDVDTMKIVTDSKNIYKIEKFNSNRDIIEFLNNQKHKESPPWRMNVTKILDIRGRYKSFLDEDYKDFTSFQKIPKNCDLLFDIDSVDEEDVEFYWQVINSGVEAVYNKDLRGEIFPSTTKGKDGRRQIEKTSYYGYHSIQCYVVKDYEQCIAQTAPFIVKIGNL
jgi:beta-lactamase superfamily II metal-dependent hydrolase